MVSDEDYEDLLDYRWYILRVKNNTYAYRKSGTKTVYMHQMVLSRMGVEAEHTHHKDENGLNNQRDNLEGKTQSRHFSDHRKAEWEGWRR